MSPHWFCRPAVRGGVSRFLASHRRLTPCRSAEHDSALQAQSVERIFGLSRDLVPLIARVRVLGAPVRPANRNLQVVAYLARAIRHGAHTAASQDDTGGPSSAGRANTLLHEVTAWTPAAGLSGLPTRVQQGNEMYLKMLRVCSLRPAVHAHVLTFRRRSCCSGRPWACAARTPGCRPSRRPSSVPAATAPSTARPYGASRVSDPDAFTQGATRLLWPAVIAGSAVSRQHRVGVLGDIK